MNLQRRELVNCMLVLRFVVNYKLNGGFSDSYSMANANIKIVADYEKKQLKEITSMWN